MPPRRRAPWWKSPNRLSPPPLRDAQGLVLIARAGAPRRDLAESAPRCLRRHAPPRRQRAAARAAALPRRRPPLLGFRCAARPRFFAPALRPAGPRRQRGAGRRPMASRICRRSSPPPPANGVARAHVAGISLGGLIAQRFAATRPELVDRLILIDTTPRYSDELRLMRDPARRDRPRGRRRADDRRAARHLVLGRRARARRRRRALRARDARALPGRGLRARLRGAQSGRPARARADIAARTLVVCGDDDIPSSLDAARWLAATIPQAELAWLEGAKHASVLESPEEARQLMRTFLQGR